ncbi:MAG: hypothetical protein WC254_02180 [Candidatus Woesearchaeota archaeon]|jgi:hypothetical protein
MKKRGQILSYHTLIELALLIFIAAGFLYFHKSVQENTLFEKSYVSRDIALLLETVQSAPGDVVMYYSQPQFDVGKYNYDFSDNLVHVYEDTILTSVYYPYFLDLSLTAPLPVFEKPAAFVITKKSRILEIGESASLIEKKSDELTCPEYASTKKQQLSLAVAADSDTSRIQSYIINNPLIGFAKKYKESTEDTSVVLILSSGTGAEINAYYSTTDDGQSEKLACILVNTIYKNIISSVPNALVEYPEKSSEETLSINPEGLAVQLVIGEDLLSESAILNSALKTGLEEYYE